MSSSATNSPTPIESPSAHTGSRSTGPGTGAASAQRLMKFTEEEIARRGGGFCSSSQETYGGTIQFYQRTGYEPVGEIKEYYKRADDKLLLAKGTLPLRFASQRSPAREGAGPGCACAVER